MERFLRFWIQQKKKSHLLLNMILNSNHYVLYGKRERESPNGIIIFLKTSDQFWWWKELKLFEYNIVNWIRVCKGKSKKK